MQEYVEIPEEIVRKAEKAAQNLLPKKSRDSYNREYEKLSTTMDGTKLCRTY